ncbi:MAG: flavoprotein, partial [bacterium]|nr:flavoprotein [bacterium]
MLLGFAFIKTIDKHSIYDHSLAWPYFALQYIERNGHNYMKGKRIGFAMCGSFCTLKSAVEQLAALKETGAQLFPIMSEIVYNTDTRFGSSANFINDVESICQNKIIHEIKNAEPIGPKQLLDLLIIAPCTGNTL